MSRDVVSEPGWSSESQCQLRTYQIRELYFTDEPAAAELDTAANGRDGIRTPSTGSVLWSTPG